MPDVPSTPRAVVRRAAVPLLAIATVVSTCVLLVGQVTPSAAGTTTTPTAPALRAGAPVPPGGVALTWSPAYMTDSHAFTAADAQQMARRYDLVAAMPVAFQQHAAAMRSTNPDLVLLAYANATLASQSNIQGLPESAFAHDLAGRRIVSPDWDEHLMESSSPHWRERAEWMCTDRATRARYDGCLVDMLTLGIFSDPRLGGGVPVNPATGRTYTQREYRDEMTDLAAYYRQKRPGLVHLGNSIENSYRYWQAPEATSRPLALSQPGAQMEDFLRGAFKPADRFPSAADWVRNVDVIRDLHEQGAVGLISTKLWVPVSDAQAARWQAYAMASFLMGADGRSYFSFSRSRDIQGVLNANVPYTVPREIGAPTGAMTRAADGTWTRRFDNGMSVVNPTTSTVTVTLPGALRALDGRTVRTVTLGPSTGEVLVGRAGPTSEPTTDPTTQPTTDPTTEPTTEPTTQPTTQPAPGRDVRAPRVAVTRAFATPRALRLAGTARDDVRVARVLVAVRHERTGRWRQPNGTWGRYRLLPARTVVRTDAGSRWNRKVPVRRSGRYGVSVVAVDRAGNESVVRPWRVIRVRR